MRTTIQSIESGLTKTPTTPFGIKMLQDEDLETLPHRHECYEITWIINGSGNHFIDSERHTIQNNQVFFIQPGQMHHLCPDNTINGFSFFFTESFIYTGELEFGINGDSNFFQLFSRINGAVINADICADVHEIVHKMQKETSNLYMFKDEVLKRYLKIFLIYLTRQLDGNIQTFSHTRNDQIVHSFKASLDKNFKHKRMVADYACELCVTPNYLNEIIKKNTGYSAGHHIRARVVLEAKRLALYTSANMKEIAYDLGFLDTAHFSKLFKMVTGINFSQFKKEKLTLTVSA